MNSPSEPSPRPLGSDCQEQGATGVLVAFTLLRPHAMDSSTFRTSLAILLGFVIVALSWSQQYRYIHWGEAVVRVHRIYGTTEVLRPNGWAQMQGSRNEKNQNNSSSPSTEQRPSKDEVLLEIQLAREKLRADSLEHVIDGLEGSAR